MKNKILVITVKYKTSITSEIYNNIIQDIYKIFPSAKDNIIIFNKPFKILTKKGLLVRQGKGKGKFSTKIKNINKNNNLILYNIENNKNLPKILLTFNNRFFPKYPYLDYFIIDNKKEN